MAKPEGLIAMLTTGGGDGSAKERAIEDFWAAQKKGDAKAGAAAFQRAYDLCAQKSEGADDAADDDEPDEDDEDELLDV